MIEPSVFSGSTQETVIFVAEAAYAVIEETIGREDCAKTPVERKRAVISVEKRFLKEELIIFYIMKQNQ
jgi:hypothetical protein